MKNKLFLTGILIISFGLTSIAQKSKINFGLKAGANYSKYVKSGESVYKRKPGFYVGGFSSVEINDKFNLQPELLFSLQGTSSEIKNIEFRESYDELPIVGDFKTNTNEYALILPLMARYSVSPAFFFEAGPQPGFIFKRQEKLVESPTSDPQFNQVYEKNITSFDLGVAIGLGFNLSDAFTVNARYYNSLIERNIDNIKSSIFNLGIEYHL